LNVNSNFCLIFFAPTNLRIITHNNKETGKHNEAIATETIIVSSAINEVSNIRDDGKITIDVSSIFAEKTNI